MKTIEERLKTNKLLQCSICHEWGHCLQYLLLGYIQFVSELEIIDSLYRVDGHLHVLGFNVVPVDSSCITYKSLHLNE